MEHEVQSICSVYLQAACGDKAKMTAAHEDCIGRYRTSEYAKEFVTRRKQVEVEVESMRDRLRDDFRRQAETRICLSQRRLFEECARGSPQAGRDDAPSSLRKEDGNIALPPLDLSVEPTAQCRDVHRGLVACIHEQTSDQSVNDALELVRRHRNKVHVSRQQGTEMPA
eukprot:CAMPEP_0118974988 /NCGR_PEP_ID=MMETSP1173-20130426/14296_1 /TAXON_ID=1034831 /ORGANISM="Rhizochromulina marina cf, Strain CCMP1243" /LENGTH=168 /DNA_ID=CAMNT_0006924809 /DNA_START=120 /DNA_END=623 /DNA_ORIENTATION=+